jgi:transposase
MKSQKPMPGRLEYTPEQLQKLKAMVLTNTLSKEGKQDVISTVDFNVWLRKELLETNVTIDKLKKILWIKTEKTSKLLEAEKNKNRAQNDSGTTQALPTKKELKKDSNENQETKGHGRIAADEYTGAEKITYTNPDLRPGDPCPKCPGKLYDTKDPGKILTVKGSAPLTVTLHEYERLRCNLCGTIFTPPMPPETQKEKFNESAKSMICLLKYGYGMPFNRLEKLQENLGIPIPRSTQWDNVFSASSAVMPVWMELQNFAAQGEIFHNDDTVMKILSVIKENKEAKATNQALLRSGMFTSGIVSITKGRKIMLFYTGREHAGENLGKLLQKRDSTLSPPTQMCDALSRNYNHNVDIILSHCLTHGRRGFFEIYSVFPEECLHVILELREVYKNDALTRHNNMSPEARLIYHQEKSKPVMDELKKWADSKIKGNEVEQNSSLGKAIKYLINHWEPLTQFLRTPGVPLTNDVCEQLLKTGILNRKNSYFYRTLKGAMIGDCLMSLIQTCIQARENPFDYLNVLQKNEKSVKKNPSLWFPWNYKQNLTENN